MSISRRNLLTGLRTTVPNFEPPPYTDPPQPPGPKPPAAHPQPVARTKSIGIQSTIASRPPAEVVAINKMTFGVTPTLPSGVKQFGLQNWIDYQLNPAGIDDGAFDAMFAAQGYLTLNMDLPTLWNRRKLMSGDAQGLAYREVRAATWLRAIYSLKQLQEVLVFAWHQHFNVYAPLYPVHYTWPDYDRRIRRNILGNFRVFLEEIATSPAMLWYLDNSSNFVEGFNENYARELFELHAMGVEAYTPGTSAPNPNQIVSGYRDWDVYEAAACFTGWTVKDRDFPADWGNTGEFTYRVEKHDKRGKFVLGQFIGTDQAPLKDGKDVLDRLHRHPATAKNVATRLARRLVADVPSASVVSAGATAFANNLDAPDQLLKVVRAILTHPDFTNVWGEKIKRPFEIGVGALRATQASWSYTDSFDWNSYLIGQKPFEWSPPNGWPDTRDAWTSSTSMLRRWNFMNYIVEGWIDGTSANVVAQTPANLTTPTQLVTFWSERLLGYLPTETDTQPFLDFMSRGRNPNVALPSAERSDRIKPLVALILASPLNQLR